MYSQLKRIIVCFALIFGLVCLNSGTLTAKNNLLLNGSFEEIGSTDMSVTDTELLYAYGEVRTKNTPADRWPSKWVIGGRPRGEELSCNGVVKDDVIDGSNSLMLASDNSSARLLASSELFEVDPSKQIGRASCRERV